ncbi:MAG TPA: serine hydrolase [Ignavibacteria bacterium]|nr:hypothetical protein [Bacteroidota bacterium]HRI85881.1 serine hydrolase [Ignavibacteria bacterium]HRK00945.1 serine hydrolase [Ignavibacteria bacterium]
MKKIIFSLLLGIASVIPFGGSANAFDSTFASYLQSKLNILKSNFNLVGISAAVQIPGKGIWTGTAGISSSDSDNVTAEMVFAAGSVTKNFIAAVILQLEEADSLSLNDSISKWIPQYQNIPGNVTINQLLDHSSGIYNVTDNPAFISAINSNLNRFWTIEEVLSGGFVLTPYFTPGSGFRYSNTGYMILGLIISKIMKTSLRDQFYKRFYKPYNLNETYFEINDTVTSPFAHNWVDLNGDGILDDAFFVPLTAINSSTIGAGGVISNPENLVRWASQIFGGNVISNNSLNKMLTFRPATISGANGYGLGTMRYQFSAGRTGYGHGGNIFGYSTIVIYDPVESISIALMINKDISAGSLGVSFMNWVLQYTTSSVTSDTEIIPKRFTLLQNYPNPFNPETKIEFHLTNNENISLSVFNILGQEVEILFEGLLPAGVHTFNWNAKDLSGGIYFYKLSSAQHSDIRKMMLVK